MRSSDKINKKKHLSLILSGCLFLVSTFLPVYIGLIQENTEILLFSLLTACLIIGGMLAAFMFARYSAETERQLVANLENFSLRMKYCYSCGHPIPEDFPPKCSQCNAKLDLIEALEELDELTAEMAIKELQALD